jgi:hypothetical protein
MGHGRQQGSIPKASISAAAILQELREMVPELIEAALRAAGSQAPDA